MSQGIKLCFTGTVFAKTCLPPPTSLPALHRPHSPCPQLGSEFLSLWEDFLLPNPVVSEKLMFLLALVIVLFEGAFSY